MRAEPVTAALLVWLALTEPSAVIWGASWALLLPKAKQSLRQAPIKDCTEGAFVFLAAKTGLLLVAGAAVRANMVDAMLLSASF